MFPLTLTDARGQGLTLKAAPQRIVSLVPSTTETLFALGAGDRIVGVTKFCAEPAEGGRSKEKVGGTKDPDLAKIRTLSPDLVLANLEENRKEDMDILADLPLFVQYPRTIGETARGVRDLGALVGAGEPAEMLARRIEEARREISEMAAGAPPIRVAYLIWRRPFWAAGKDTYVADLLHACGAVNVFADRKGRYFEVGLDDLAAARPDAILFPDEPYPFKPEHLEEFGARPDIPAVAQDRLILADGRLLCWHGVRTPEGLHYLWKLLAAPEGAPSPTADPPKRRSRSSGVILVLISGILCLMLLMGILFLQMIRLSDVSSHAALRACSARLSAQSGMQYAATRLLQGALQESPSSSDRGDRWAWRDSPFADLAAARNPSFSHGEAWTDASHVPDGLDNDGDGELDETDELDCVYVPGDDGFTADQDRDLDGSFSAWSGRLRESHGEGRFTLRVECEDGKIPLNAGSLETANRYGGPNPDYSDVGSPLPDHCDPNIPYHAGLAHALNNLGGILHRENPGLLSTRCADVAAAGAEPIRTSWLGFDLIRNRPAGGYRDWAQVERVLTNLSNPAPHNVGGPYTWQEVEAIRPFVGLGPHQTLPETGRVMHTYLSNFPAYAPTHLPAADRRVLEAIWTYLSGWPGNYPEALPGELADWETTDYGRVPSRLYRFMPFPVCYPRPVLFPDDAGRLARRAMVWRQSGGGSWQQLHAWISAEARDLFVTDAFDFAPDANLNGRVEDSEILSPSNLQSWIQAKADLAFRAVALDTYTYDGVCQGCATWAGWGTDRGIFAGPKIRPASFVPFQQLRSPPSGSIGDQSITRIPYPPFFGAPYADPLEPYYKGGTAPWTVPQGFSLGPPTHFRVESLGVGRSGYGPATTWSRVEGILCVLERLDFASQEDFECLMGGTRLAQRGIQVRDDLPGYAQRRDSRPDAWPDSRPDYPHIVSHPRVDRRSHTTVREGPLGHGFSRIAGALTLSAKQAGLAREGGTYPGARIYVAPVEDFAPASNPNTEGPGGNFAYNNGWWSVSDKQDSYITNPLVQSLYINPNTGFQCPGFEAPPGPGVNVDTFSMEFWITPPGFCRIGSNDGGQYWLEVSANRYGGVNPSVPHTEIRLWGAWPQTGDTLDFSPLIVEDEVQEGPTSWFYHVVVAATRVPGGTDFQLYLNGSDEIDDQQIPVFHHPFPLEVTDKEFLSTANVGEIRLYDNPLSLDDARRLYRYERFVRDGTYTSPLYVFEKPSDLLRTQWTGLPLPETYRAQDPADPVNSPPDPTSPLAPFTVEVHGYSDTLGSSEVPGSPATLGSSGGWDSLSVLGQVLSFRYTVRMDCRQAAGPLRDSPVFESICFSMRRPGRWNDWWRYSER